MIHDTNMIILFNDIQTTTLTIIQFLTKNINVNNVVLLALLQLDFFSPKTKTTPINRGSFLYMKSIEIIFIYC